MASPFSGMARLSKSLERIKKNRSHAVGEKRGAVFLSFGIVSAPAFAKATARQAVTGFFKPAPSPKPRQNSKILAPHAYIFSLNALKIYVRHLPKPDNLFGTISNGLRKRHYSPQSPVFK
jgi:hypothetical protein